MWSFSIPKSSIALIIIEILLFAEMNAIASLKLQSFNNNRARRNPLTANTKCCSDIVIPIALDVTNLFGSVGTLAIGGLIDIGIGLSLLVGAGSAWKGKTTYPSHHFNNYRVQSVINVSASRCTLNTAPLHSTQSPTLVTFGPLDVSSHPINMRQ
ncbi:hypothetical protein DINM_000437 [Dirofilaria immitis]|nr:hypothetical protein [Dirofilaria immitis]